MALTPGQISAEEEADTEAETIACSDLDSLAMHVNTSTLQRSQELTKEVTSSDGLCTLTLTLIDGSSEDNPASSLKSCKVKAVPTASNNHVDVTVTPRGECDTVGYATEITLPDSMGTEPPSDGVVGRSVMNAYGELRGYDPFGIWMFSNIVDSSTQPTTVG